MDGAILLTCLSLLAYDGDTFKCDGKSMRPMGDGKPDISGYDTPEIRHRARCELENELGKRATVRFQELLDTPGVKVFDSREEDVYDRPLVWVVLPNGRTAGSILIEEGHARVWTPDYEADWCG
ncbi:thermonuclease family protein [Roseibium sp.]|uniref:thermonuclease family protein n=1 Tax=Roseibium sp. TaxID=1936156 RepID=UPI003B50CF8C